MVSRLSSHLPETSERPHAGTDFRRLRDPSAEDKARISHNKTRRGEPWHARQIESKRPQSGGRVKTRPYTTNQNLLP